jgi:transcriptional regulator with XRE-family HTH domain
MTFAEKLNALMHDKRVGITAERIGIHPVTLNDYRRGKFMPKSETAAKLARVLGVDLTWLLDESQAWPPVPAKKPYFPPAPETAKAA